MIAISMKPIFHGPFTGFECAHTLGVSAPGSLAYTAFSAGVRVVYTPFGFAGPTCTLWPHELAAAVALALELGSVLLPHAANRQAMAASAVAPRTIRIR